MLSGLFSVIYLNCGFSYPIMFHSFITNTKGYFYFSLSCCGYDSSYSVDDMERKRIYMELKINQKNKVE